MKKRSIVIAVLAVVLVLGGNIGSALAYFTTYAKASGGYTIHLGAQTEIEERVSNWTKHVTVTVEDGSEPVYVRVKAFAGSQYALTYSDENGNWTLGDDGYYYYALPVSGGGSTEELLIQIGNVPEEDVDSFHVAVVYETTPVLYDSNGAPYGDWTVTLDSGTTEGGGA